MKHVELPSSSETDNLATLPEVTERILVEKLRERFKKNQIYVSSPLKHDECLRNRKVNLWIFGHYLLPC